jgi:hypothetical protein
MAAKKKQRKRPEAPTGEMLMQTLSAALKKQEDFIVTFETTDEGNRCIHTLTGRLITPCMLGTLSNRCQLPEQEGSTHTMLEQG